MAEKTLYLVWMTAGAVFLLVQGGFFLMLKPENLKRFESVPRNRVFGLIAGWFALFWCIPHAQAVAPAFLLPLMKPLAVIVPIASFFCLDYMTARAVGGLLIIFAYEALHRSFDLDLPCAGVIAVLCWILGGCGVWISGIPYHFRDAIRLAAEKRKWRYLFGIFLVLCGILFCVSGVFLI